jgi:hypothetical protein
MDNKYWRVTLKDRVTKVDVEADIVNIDGKNNLYFTIDGEPIVGFIKGEWRAFIQIDKIGGEPLWTSELETPIYAIERQQLEPLTDPY